MNPVVGDIWDARDGGSYYVTARTPRMVAVQRWIIGDYGLPYSRAGFWMRLTTFRRAALSRRFPPTADLSRWCEQTTRRS